MLKEHLAQTGTTQRDFARQVGITEGYLSLILNGNKTPSLAVAARIERLTNGAVKASSLAGGEQTKGAA